MTTTDYIDDIPLEAAYRAHLGTSFVPEDRAQQERAGYAETLTKDYERLSKIADTPEKQATLAEEFERYREGYKRHSLDWLNSRSRMISTMIAGPSNFPVQRQEKRANAAHKRLTGLMDFRKRALDAIEKKLCPELRPIMAGDSDAIQRLQAEIDNAERLQEMMKAVNAAWRKSRGDREAQVAAMTAAMVAAGMGEKAEYRSRQLIEPDFCGRIGFADYELKNNNANIRRMKQRLAAIQVAKSKPDTEIEGENARIEDCPAENRVRLYFPGKPAADIRNKLKSSGFRWAPSLECWQAYRNDRSFVTAREVAGVA